MTQVPGRGVSLAVCIKEGEKKEEEEGKKRETERGKIKG